MLLCNRRCLLRLAGIAAASCPSILFGDEPKTPVDRARKFLTALFDPQLNLLPEFRGSKTYWLYHDNYLAAKVLQGTEPALSRRIMTSIRSLGVMESGKIEILFGEARKPLPFRHFRLEEVKRVGEKVIKTEVAGEKIHTDWFLYTDLLFMAAIAEAGNDKASAVTHFEAGLKTWTGTGFRDRVNQKNGLYATYKLALAIIAAHRLGREDHQVAMQKQLVAMQRPDGGFITDYNGQGKPVGEANVETTSLAILAIDSK